MVKHVTFEKSQWCHLLKNLREYLFIFQNVQCVSFELRSTAVGDMGPGGIMTRGLGSHGHPHGLTPSGGGSGPRVTWPPLPLSPRGVGPLLFRPRGLGRPDPLWYWHHVYEQRGSPNRSYCGLDERATLHLMQRSARLSGL